MTASVSFFLFGKKMVTEAVILSDIFCVSQIKESRVVWSSIRLNIVFFWWIVLLIVEQSLSVERVQFY